MTFLGSIIIILMSSLILGRIATAIRLPAVVGQLLGGILIGPAGLHLVSFTPTLHQLAELGVIGLMFLAGVNSDVSRLKKYLRPSLIIAVCGMAVPMAVISWIGMRFGWPLKDALFLGVIFSATSVSITVAVLQELHQLNSRAGTTILGAAVADDVLTLILLSAVVTLTGERLNGQVTAGWNIGLVVLVQVGYFVAVYLVAKHLIPTLFRVTKLLVLPNGVAIVSVIVGLAMAFSAELIGLSAITGAFFAGLAIGQTKFRSAVDQQVGSGVNLLLVPIFFASIGSEMQWTGLVQQLPLFGALTLFAILTKLVGAGIGSRLTGVDWNTSWMVGAGMVSRGEVALIIAQIVYANHLLNAAQYSTVVGAVIVTTVFAPVLLKWTSR